MHVKVSTTRKYTHTHKSRCASKEADATPSRGAVPLISTNYIDAYTHTHKHTQYNMSIVHRQSESVTSWHNKPIHAQTCANSNAQKRPNGHGRELQFRFRRHTRAHTSMHKHTHTHTHTHTHQRKPQRGVDGARARQDVHPCLESGAKRIASVQIACMCGLQHMYTTDRLTRFCMEFARDLGWLRLEGFVYSPDTSLVPDTRSLPQSFAQSTNILLL